MKHLILQLQAPMMSFGAVAIDTLRVTGPHPGHSLVTGIISNALGLDRSQGREIQEIQDHLILAVRIDREPAGTGNLRDFQTAEIHKGQTGWTTRGYPEAREGGEYERNLIYKDYHQDMKVMMSVRLTEGCPVTLEDVENALRRPARPLFIGRKTCLPSAPILAGSVQADNAVAALLVTPLKQERGQEKSRNGERSAEQGRIRMAWPAGEGDSRVPGTREFDAAYLKNWVTTLHGGTIKMFEGDCPVMEFGHHPEETGSINERAAR